MEDFELLDHVLKERRYDAALSSLKEEISSAKNLDEALERTLNKVVNLVSAQAGTLWFYDRFVRGIIYARVVYGGGDLSNIKLKPGEGIAGQVIKCGDGSIIKDCQKDERWANKVDDATGFKTMSMMCVPLKWRQYAFGCIQIINKTDGTIYDDKDYHLATKLAATISKTFEESGLLTEYSDAADSIVDRGLKGTAKEIHTLQDVFQMSHFEEIEKAIYEIEGFASLGERSRKDILRHAREIFLIWQKSSKK